MPKLKRDDIDRYAYKCERVFVDFTLWIRRVEIETTMASKEVRCRHIFIKIKSFLINYYFQLPSYCQKVEPCVLLKYFAREKLIKE